MVPKMALFWGNGGVDIKFCVRDPEKAHPWAEPRVLAYYALKSVQCPPPQKKLVFGAQSHACAETIRLGGL